MPTPTRPADPDFGRYATKPTLAQALAARYGDPRAPRNEEFEAEGEPLILQGLLLRECASYKAHDPTGRGRIRWEFVDSSAIVTYRDHWYVEGRNLTGKKSLDRMASDPRVEEIWMEDDGYRMDGKPAYWANIRRGYNWCDCTSIHEGTIAELYAALKDVEEGLPADSCERTRP